MSKMKSRGLEKTWTSSTSVYSVNLSKYTLSNASMRLTVGSTDIESCSRFLLGSGSGLSALVLIGKLVNSLVATCLVLES